MKKKKKIFLILILPVIVAAVTVVVMLLWNAILPGLIHVGTITFWQAMGLLILCKILFGGFGGGGCKRGGARTQFRNKWKNMSDEERQKFKEEWKNRCHHRTS